jgi:hypothetical protein
MEKVQIWAQPWWVNLLVLIPFTTYFAFRRKGPLLNWRRLTALAIFAAAFGFAEAAVVVYLRAAMGLLPGYTGTLSQLQHFRKAITGTGVHTRLADLQTLIPGIIPAIRINLGQAALHHAR